MTDEDRAAASLAHAAEPSRSESDGWQPRGLVVCGTPIGNLEDVSPRLRRALAGVDAIACEDTRRTRALLSALGIRAPRLLSHRQDNEQAAAAGIVALLERGQRIALVTDAGMPAISDPGTPLVRAALERGIPVSVVPGPSAVSCAIAVSGCQGAHTFVGFLPRSAQVLSQLVTQSAHQVLVAFEAPGRLLASLRTVAAEQPDRTVVLCRELTKRHEQVVRSSAAALAETVERDGLERGEIVLVFDALPAEDDGQDAVALTLAQRMVGAGVSTRDASRIAAETFGVRPNPLRRQLVADADAATEAEPTGD